MTPTAGTVRVLPDAAALFLAAARRVVELGQAAIAARGAFHLALAGGSTPAGLYRLLATPAFAGQMDWHRSHIYFGDERAVPPDHADSNYRMARDTLLAPLAISEAQVHRIPTEHPPAEAAAAYSRCLRQHLPPEGFDLLLLGMGADGHIASLFPGSAALDQRNKPAAVATHEPKLAAAGGVDWRITLTLPTLNQARHTLLLVSGAPKADVVRHVLRRVAGAAPLPVQMLHPAGTLEWLLDREAARHLDLPVES